MTHIRLSFTADDRARALLAARRVRKALVGTRFLLPENVDKRGRIYFDVEGEAASLRERARSAVGGNATVDAEDVQNGHQAPDECINCGNIPDEPVAICPACDFVEISPCPHCRTPIPRTAYASVAASVYQCPKCDARVSLRYADPLFDEHGHYNQPVVDVVLLAAGRENV